MKELAIVKKYARALAEVALERKAHKRISAELATLLEVWNSSKEFREVMLNPMFTSKRLEIANAVAERLNLSEEVARFLNLLVEHKRIGLLPDIVERYRLFVEDALGIVRVEVISAIKLNEETRNLLKERIESALGKQIRIIERVEPQILGGLVVRIGSKVFDGSVKGQLEALKKAILKER